MNNPDWSKSSAIYELNTRQFTPEGTFEAAKKHLPRIKDLGIDIIWLMPIYPIGEKDRKGTLGSYYSIRDYKAINPEFGTFDDFKSFVAEAKSLGLHVLIDWVANHTSRDSVWTITHPDWYKRNEQGEIIAPYDWTDVAQLDTFNHDMWKGMAEAMIFWLNETDIDGFRCDMASLLPVEFWNYIRHELDKVRPVFMLAESEDQYLHQNAFNATYCWELHHILNDLAKEKDNIGILKHYFKKQECIFSRNDLRMAFTSNHDENSWSGSEFERMGLAAKQMAVLTFVIPGIPLIYNGQEVAMSHRLSFFEKDNIEWNVNLDYTLLYKKLCALKRDYEPLWNGSWGGDISISVNEENKTAEILRSKNDELVVALFNFSSSFTSVALPYTVSTDYMTGTRLTPGAAFKLGPWQYLILVKDVRR